MQQVGREVVLPQAYVCLQSSAEQHLADGWQLCWEISWLWDFERECSTSEELQAQYQHICHLLFQLRKGVPKRIPLRVRPRNRTFFHPFCALVQPRYSQIIYFFLWKVVIMERGGRGIVHGKNVKIIRKQSLLWAREICSRQDDRRVTALSSQYQKKVKHLHSLLRIYTSISRKGKEWQR